MAPAEVPVTLICQPVSLSHENFLTMEPLVQKLSPPADSEPKRGAAQAIKMLPIVSEYGGSRALPPLQNKCTSSQRQVLRRLAFLLHPISFLVSSHGLLPRSLSYLNHSEYVKPSKTSTSCFKIPGQPSSPASLEPTLSVFSRFQTPTASFGTLFPSADRSDADILPKGCASEAEFPARVKLHTRAFKHCALFPLPTPHGHAFSRALDQYFRAPRSPTRRD
ncbi:hypothetical protein B0H14DRAFT_2635597 [Mycena olivaceomarginata]|nr:hypothetical protein B0H14DRAFT_2635597 [Mycena olivaceomarginata]